MNHPFSPTTLLAAFLIGALSAYLAHRRGRNLYLWFFVGFFFGILGIFAIFLASSPSNKKSPTAAEAIQAIQAPIDPLAPLNSAKDKFWYYLDPNQQQQGPMSLDALKGAWKQGKIHLLTYVWNEELSDWKPLQDLLKNP